MRDEKLWLFLCILGVAGGCSQGSKRNRAHDGGADSISTTTTRSADAAPGARSADASAVDAALIPVHSDAGEPLLESSDAASQPARGADGGDPDAAFGATSDAGPTLDSSLPTPTPTVGCLGGITDYKRRGKFMFNVETVNETDDFAPLRLSMKMWVPVLPTGCKVPVVHWSNGTGASCSNYTAILEHLASHGFLTSCYETTNSTQAESLPCFTALEAVYKKYPGLADDKLGSAGHALGGAAALVCLQRAEAKWGTSKLYAGHSMAPESGAGAPWQAAYAQIRSPMFLFSGTDDMLVSASWVNQAFEALADTSEVYWYEGQGATHIPIPVRWAEESAVVFFRWKLLGDKKACEYFKAMPSQMDWKLQKSQAEQGC